MGSLIYKRWWFSSRLIGLLTLMKLTHPAERCKWQETGQPTNCKELRCSSQQPMRAWILTKTWLSWLECGASRTRVTGSTPTWAPIRTLATTLSLGLEADPSPVVSRALANTLFAAVRDPETEETGSHAQIPDIQRLWYNRCCFKSLSLGILFYGAIEKWSRYFLEQPSIKKSSDQEKRPTEMDIWWTLKNKKKNSDQLTVRSMS